MREVVLGLKPVLVPTRRLEIRERMSRTDSKVRVVKIEKGRKPFCRDQINNVISTRS